MISTVIQRFLVSNILTVYYSVLILFNFLLTFLKNPFNNPWKQKLVLVPPARLSDPKYGVHKYVKANNIKLHYVESGDPDKPLMLFLHGFPEFWFSWRHQIVEFNKDYWCIAFDMRGYGDSERPEEVSAYKIDLLVEDVRDLMRKLGRNKCIMVSHDWGGLIATKFRDTHPDALDAVVVLASTSREAWSQEIWNNPEQKKKSWYLFFYRMPKLPELMLQMNDLQIFDNFLRLQENYVDEYDIECYKFWFRKQDALSPPVNYYRANFQLTFPNKYRDENVPMLVANGRKDPYILPEMLDRIKTEYKHMETILVEEAFHFLQQESPEKVNNIIRGFLAKNKLCLTDPKYGVHKYIKANNVKLHYVESGDPSKPLMLFLHGFPEFWYTWRHQIVEFQKDYCCVALDMRGYGDSEKPEGISSYKLDILVEDVRDFIRKLGRNKGIIVSHDWGGVVASKFRDTHPDYVAGVILFASITRESWHREIWSNLNQHLRSWYTFFFLAPKLPEWALERGDLEMFEYMFKHDDKNVDKDAIECYKYTFSKPGSFTPPVNYYRAIFSLTCPEKYVDNNVPMLVANAEKDTAIVPNILNRIKEEYKYVETMLVKDSHHFLQEQEPGKVNSIMREFLDKHKL